MIPPQQFNRPSRCDRLALKSVAISGLVAGLALFSLAGLPGRSQGFGGSPGGMVFSPAPGNLCDRANQACFDAQGLAVPMTRHIFGRSAEKNALRILQTQGAPRQFLLSNGVACDVNVRLCWEDGTRRRVVSQAATQQLFGTAPPTPADQPNVNRSTGQCRLSRQYQILYSGTCELRQMQDGNRQRFVVTLGNGTRYAFDNRRGEFRISDGTGGSWPVQFKDRGRSAEFRWADLLLQATQNAYQGSTKPNLGRNLGQLLEALFN